MFSENESKLVKELRSYCEARYDSPGHGDWLKECHDSDELIEDFIRPSKCTTIEEVVSCEEVISFLNIMKIRAEAVSY